ncbi:MAG TPA: hypothetical protein VLK30_02155 [Candidatus Limnocylindrales bacterium]|nr:hypothetical protein [Candidatus Limnocylindrales bacterium]
MSENPSAAVGQVSADGQFRWDGVQWVPIPRGVREPTPWTRPMQLAVAAFFALEAAFSVVTSALFINHDSMLRVMQAQGTSIPQGTDINTVINISIFFAWAVVIVIALLELFGALGSYLGWRWIFWVALVLLGLGAIGAVTNLGTFAHPDTSPVPTWGVAVSELFSIASLGLFVWMLIGVIRFGPWAMKKPGA